MQRRGTPRSSRAISRPRTPGAAPEGDYDDPTARARRRVGQEPARQGRGCSAGTRPRSTSRKSRYGCAAPSAPHRCTGYEVFLRCLKTENAYAEIVRWNGKRGDFTSLRKLSGPQYGVQDGDIVEAIITGNVITRLHQRRRSDLRRPTTSIDQAAPESASISASATPTSITGSPSSRSTPTTTERDPAGNWPRWACPRWEAVDEDRDQSVPVDRPHARRLAAGARVAEADRLRRRRGADLRSRRNEVGALGAASGRSWPAADCQHSDRGAMESAEPRSGGTGGRIPAHAGRDQLLRRGRITPVVRPSPGSPRRLHRRRPHGGGVGTQRRRICAA